MKTRKVHKILIAVTLASLLQLPGAWGQGQVKSEVPIVTSLAYNGGKAVEVKALVVNGKLFVEILGLAASLKVTPVDYPSNKNVYIGGKPIGQFTRYENRTYVSVDEVAEKLNLKAEPKENNLFLDLWSGVGDVSTAQINCSLARYSKGTSPFNGEDAWSYTVNVRNNSNAIVKINANQFRLVDSEGKIYSCVTNFEQPVPGRASKTFDNLVFNVPKGKALKEIFLQVEDNRVGRVRL